MPKLIRRDALRTLVGGSATALFGVNGAQASESPGCSAALVQGTMTTEHAQGRQMCGFIQTGIRNGQTLCSLRPTQSRCAFRICFAKAAWQSCRCRSYHSLLR